MTEKQAGGHLHTLLETAQERWGSGQSADWSVPPRTSLWGDDHKTDPYQLSQAVVRSFTVAVDHLQTLSALLVTAKVLPVYGAFSICRGALEASATGLWLLAPAPRPERLTRRLRLEATNARDADSFRSSAEVSGGRSLVERLERLESLAQDVGIEPRRLRERVTSTEIVTEARAEVEESLLSPLAAWKGASGFAHGRDWASVSLLSKEEIGRQENTLHVRLTADVMTVLWMTRPVVNILHRIDKLWQQRTLSRD